MAQTANDRKNKIFMLRLTDEEYLATREAAFSRGLGMAPMLMDYLRPQIPAMKKINERIDVADSGEGRPAAFGPNLRPRQSWRRRSGIGSPG